MFIDELELILIAGHGGPGKVSFRPAMGGPDGGHGGRGGSIYAVATQDILALAQYQGKHKIIAINGEPGGKNGRTGKDSEDTYITVPIGTVLIDQDGNQLSELLTPGEEFLICKGGLGGKGNEEFKSSTNTTPKYAQPGLPGQRQEIKFIVRLIADFGLIGLPNAGKSSLLNELTAAHVKTANYPFTTLEPNLGVMNGLVLADIPGLIEGASEGKGLGIKFLKHIEKVGLIIHCISCESTDVVKDYEVVRGELKNFDEQLVQKAEIILLTKSDLINADALQVNIKKLQKFAEVVLPISIYNLDSIEKLKKIMVKYK